MPPKAESFSISFNNGPGPKPKPKKKKNSLEPHRYLKRDEGKCAMGSVQVLGDVSVNKKIDKPCGEHVQKSKAFRDAMLEMKKRSAQGSGNSAFVEASVVVTDRPPPPPIQQNTTVAAAPRKAAPRKDPPVTVATPTSSGDQLQSRRLQKPKPTTTPRPAWNSDISEPVQVVDEPTIYEKTRSRSDRPAWDSTINEPSQDSHNNNNSNNNINNNNSRNRIDRPDVEKSGSSTARMHRPAWDSNPPESEIINRNQRGGGSFDNDDISNDSFYDRLDKSDFTYDEDRPATRERHQRSRDDHSNRSHSVPITRRGSGKRHSGQVDKYNTTMHTRRAPSRDVAFAMKHINKSETVESSSPSSSEQGDHDDDEAAQIISEIKHHLQQKVDTERRRLEQQKRELKDIQKRQQADSNLPQHISDIRQEIDLLRTEWKDKEQQYEITLKGLKHKAAELSERNEYLSNVIHKKRSHSTSLDCLSDDNDYDDGSSADVSGNWNAHASASHSQRGGLRDTKRDREREREREREADREREKEREREQKRDQERREKEAREVREKREKEARDKREKEAREKREKEAREKREKEAREKREKEARQREIRERERREREQREQEKREAEQHEREVREKREKETREREHRDRERREKALREKREREQQEEELREEAAREAEQREKENLIAQQKAASLSSSVKKSSPPTTVNNLIDDDSEPIDDNPNDVLVDERRNYDGKIERYYTSRKREVIYSNGTTKVVYPSGHIVLEFNNGDVRKVCGIIVFIEGYSEKKKKTHRLIQVVEWFISTPMQKRLTQRPRMACSILNSTPTVKQKNIIRTDQRRSGFLMEHRRLSGQQGESSQVYLQGNLLQVRRDVIRYSFFFLLLKKNIFFVFFHFN